MIDEPCDRSSVSPPYPAPHRVEGVCRGVSEQMNQLLTGTDLAEDAVVRCADDRVQEGPACIMAGGAFVGGVTLSWVG